ncbi:MAG TPA: hypothetical protein VHS57_09985, partial [Acidimicrobiales bacterium]|nr:hypothetical protein [Acidimicrobiales bacterium]
KLVRDADGKESYDDPPDGEWTVTPTPIVVDIPPDHSRQDAFREQMAEAAEFGSTWGSTAAMPGRLDDRDR